MKIYLSKLLSAMAIAALFIALSPVPQVMAQQSAGQSYLRFDRMKAATAPGSVLVVFTTSATTFTETQFRLTLDSEWVSATNFAITPANYTVSTAGLPVGVTAMPGIATATSVTGNTIVFPVTALANSTTYGFFITGTGLITNPAASFTINHTLATSDSTPNINDSKSVASPTVTNDQILVTAEIAPTFTFTIGSNTANLGALSSAAVSSGAGNSVTVLTNAAYGWTAWMRSLNSGLTSLGATKTIATTGTIDAAPSSITAGTEGYVVDVNLTTDAAGGGTVSIAGEYNGATVTAGGTVASTYQTIASSTGAANSDVVTIIPRVAISGSTPAASDYTDTLTVVGAGTF